MKRKICLFLFVLLLLPIFTVSVEAKQNAFVIDNADLLSNSEEDSLQSTISQLRDLYGMDVVILTVNTLDGKRPQDYADDYYDEHDFGENGLLFLLSMEERDWYISTSGNAIYALTDYGIQEAAGVALPYLGKGDYYGGFTTFLTVLPTYFDAFEAGKPIDGNADYSGDYYHGDQDEVVYYEEPFEPSFGFSLIIGLVISLITVLIMRISMNTKRPQRSAAVYMDRNTYRVTEHQDIFLYSTVSKVKRETSSSSSGGGGGSSVHTSSSGNRHGGGGGKF